MLCNNSFVPMDSLQNKKKSLVNKTGPFLFLVYCKCLPSYTITRTICAFWKNAEWPSGHGCPQLHLVNRLMAEKEFCAGVYSRMPNCHFTVLYIISIFIFFFLYYVDNLMTADMKAHLDSY